VSKKTKKAV